MISFTRCYVGIKKDVRNAMHVFAKSHNWCQCGMEKWD